MAKKSRIFILILLLSGCSSVTSLFDGVYRIWKSGEDIKEIQTLIPGFQINSSFAKEYGVKINATSREIYNQIHSVIGKRKYLNFEQLKKITNEIHAN